MSFQDEQMSTGSSPSLGPSDCSSPDLPTSSSQSSLESLSDSNPFALEDAVHHHGYILVVGGLGYIGSHTCLELLKDGHNVIVVDSLSNSFESTLVSIRTLAAKHWAAQGRRSPSIDLYKIDYRSTSMRAVLGRYVLENDSNQLSSIRGVIHFAAYKSVEESTIRPLDYYLNNVAGLIDFLGLLEVFGIYNFVFSSSATVYGSTMNRGAPLHEEHLVHHETKVEGGSGEMMHLVPGITGLTSPYGRTKYFCEAILADVAHANPAWRMTALRYFNPVGCEPSGMLGESPRQTPTNLFPVIAQVLTGKREVLSVFGTDWSSGDGTATRDFIHVVDLARGHLAALGTAMSRPDHHAFRAYNLGTGTGSTVAQVVSCLEAASSQSIPVKRVGRRTGDVGYCVAATARASTELGWRTQHSLAECARDTWHCLQMSQASA
ncbi:hypothetical protein LTR86_004347 [Recurvomyces mirabilis]|nr:hypothetical protein LTR86_004347 [Recurvomyces mirabilis]